MSNVQSDMFALVLGDSRSLPRGTAKVSYRETYPFLMEAWWKARSEDGNITIWPWADGSLLIQEVLERYKKFRFYLGDARLDVCLVMVGLVDCAPRPLSWGARDRLSRWPEPVKRLAIRWLHRHRPWLLSHGLFFRFTEPVPFRKTFGELVQGISKGFQRGYVINIAPAAELNYARSPGLKESIEEYNTLIAQETARFDNLALVDIWGDFMYGGVPLEAYLCDDDGMHFTAQGHWRIHELIVMEEQRRSRAWKGGGPA